MYFQRFLQENKKKMKMDQLTYGLGAAVSPLTEVKKVGDRSVGGDRLVANNRQRGEAVDGLNIYIARNDVNRCDWNKLKFSARIHVDRRM